MDKILHLEGMTGEFMPRWISDQYNIAGDLDGTFLRRLLEENGYTVTKNGDAGTHGFCITENGFYVSSSGFVGKQSAK